LKHHASPDFWACFSALPQHIQEVARKNFELLKQDPTHPSLHFKKVGDFVSARVGISYRALGVNVPDGILWFWIGSHADYDRVIGS
jgi:hypothetical protein